MFMPHWPKIVGYRPIEFGLTPITQLLEKLGNPHLKLPPVIHVAGTNGKGSTIAIMRSILEASGLRVHCYTSPHLLHFNERIILAGHTIDDNKLTQLAEECRLAAGDDIQVSFFEATTAMAFLAFSRVDADICLLETGMGGRLDATNVVPNPVCNVITPISFDHTEYLGDNLIDIASEKAGIIKKNSHCIISQQYPEVMQHLQQHAKDRALCWEEDFMIERTEQGFRYHFQDQHQNYPLPALNGPHQLINAATAITTLNQLNSPNITPKTIQEGLTTVRWPGRMQHIDSNKHNDVFPSGWQCWIDGAHNQAGMHVLSCLIDDWADKAPIYVICGFTKGRDPVDILSPILDQVNLFCPVLVSTEPSAQKAEDISTALEQKKIANKPFQHLHEAIHYITSTQQPGKIICCGSLYLLSDIYKLLGKSAL